MRAENPSRKSNIMAARISHDAVTMSPSDAKIMAKNPDARFKEVIKFGICFIVSEDIIFDRGVKLR
jgi:hypothetical protein